jgi:REP element-mobilizing transposase RayT
MKRVVRPCIALSAKPFFRVVEFNVLSNHIHLICEADDAVALARGVQGLAIRLARRLNTALKRKGTLFGPLSRGGAALAGAGPQHAALRLAHRKHHAPANHVYAGWIDPYSSGVWFRGSRAPVRMNAFNRELATLDAPTKAPRT